MIEMGTDTATNRYGNGNCSLITLSLWNEEAFLLCMKKEQRERTTAPALRSEKRHLKDVKLGGPWFSFCTLDMGSIISRICAHPVSSFD